MRKETDYVSPAAKVVLVENTEDVLCASTEGYGVNGQSYGEDDWD